MFLFLLACKSTAFFRDKLTKSYKSLAIFEKISPILALYQNKSYLCKDYVAKQKSI